MRNFFSLVTFSHTVFALPFALLGYTLGVRAAQGAFAWLDLALVVGCMVTARNAAMAFNRLVDAPIDARNARTVVRDIPAGRVSKRSAGVFVAVNCAAFVVLSGLLNSLCLALSPVALAVVLGYSYTKRFTWLCHVVLGIGLALAPVGAYLAATGAFALQPILLGLVVLTWVAGFDIVYALQDEAFDRAHALYSVPTRFGASRSIALSRSLHLVSLGLLAYVTYDLVLEDDVVAIWLVLAWVAFAAALAYQHSIVSARDLTRIDRAFFTTNGLASVVYAAMAVAGLLL